MTEPRATRAVSADQKVIVSLANIAIELEQIEKRQPAPAPPAVREEG